MVNNTHQADEVEKRIKAGGLGTSAFRHYMCPDTQGIDLPINTGGPAYQVSDALYAPLVVRITYANKHMASQPAPSIAQDAKAFDIAYYREPTVIASGANLTRGVLTGRISSSGENCIQGARTSPVQG